MKIKIGKGLYEKLNARIGAYQCEVGVLEDKPHYEPVHTSIGQDPDLKEYAGGKARKISKVKSELTTGQILVENMKRLNINILEEPFEKKNSDIVKFANAYLKMALSNAHAQRVINLMQAIVRNPILKQEYGHNTPATADAKGFDRNMIDTGQMFRAIRARIKNVRK